MSQKGKLGLYSRDVREQAAKTTIRNVRAQGHTYIDLREEGKRFIFFCSLCISPCYSDSALFDHLNGYLHLGRQTAAKATLLASNPWPFSDGFLFFDHPSHTNNSNSNDMWAVSTANHLEFLKNAKNGQSLAIIDPKIPEITYYTDQIVQNNSTSSSNDQAVVCRNNPNVDILIPGVLVNDKVIDLEAMFVGFGQIGARLDSGDGDKKNISKIWCEWIGKRDVTDAELFLIPEHDYAVLTFNYNFDLGKRSLFDDIRHLLCKPLGTRRYKKRGRPSSASYFFGSSSNKNSSLKKITSKFHFDQHKRFSRAHCIRGKYLRREIRKQQRLVSERLCGICHQRIFPGKDVATLFNMKTGRLACSSGNNNGAFHLFHISCLIHWILLCESEMLLSTHLSLPRIRGSSLCEEENKGSVSENNTTTSSTTPICSVFCPECQATGIITQGNETERRTIPLYQIFGYKIRVSEAHRRWMKCPQSLQNCSVGFCFCCESEEEEEEDDDELGQVALLKLIHFYRADRSQYS